MRKGRKESEASAGPGQARPLDSPCPRNPFSPLLLVRWARASAAQQQCPWKAWQTTKWQWDVKTAFKPFPPEHFLAPSSRFKESA